MLASAGETPMADHVGLDRWKLDLVVFADQLSLRAGRKRRAAALANGGRMVSKLVRIVRQSAAVRFMSGLRPARTRILPRFLLVGRRRLGRGARILVRTLKPQHQIDQLLFACLLYTS